MALVAPGNETVRLETPVEFSFYEIAVLPVLIFTARVVDVSMGTLRIIFLSKQLKLLATVTSFFEVAVWLLAIGQIFQNLSSWHLLLAYAGGYATGNYVGLLIEERLAVGMAGIRIFVRTNEGPLVQSLQKAGIGYTVLNGHGAVGPVRMVYVFARRREVPAVISILDRVSPNAFFVIEEVKTTRNGIFAGHPFSPRKPLTKPARLIK